MDATLDTENMGRPSQDMFLAHFCDIKGYPCSNGGGTGAAAKCMGTSSPISHVPHTLQRGVNMIEYSTVMWPTMLVSTAKRLPSPHEPLKYLQGLRLPGELPQCIIRVQLSGRPQISTADYCGELLLHSLPYTDLATIPNRGCDDGSWVGGATYAPLTCMLEHMGWRRCS